MSLLARIAAAAKDRPQRIVLPEGTDGRIIEGGLRAAAEGLANVTLLADETQLQSVADRCAGRERVTVISPETSQEFACYVETYAELRRHKNITVGAAREAMRNPLNYAAMMVRLGVADGTIGGAEYTTAETVRAALQIIGRRDDVSVVSSFFLIVPDGRDDHPLAFADCALVVEPTAEELADIARSTAESFRALVGAPPRVAMLSFSTKGSANSATVERVVAATSMVQRAEPSLVIDGELQFDAAFVPNIAATKAPGSPLDGDANVFVFPNLDAGNIGYKIAQRMGGATAIGPILQGLVKPANDLSRGCSADDVYHMIAVTGAQAASAGSLSAQSRATTA